jgi:heptosyltransferase II
MENSHSQSKFLVIQTASIGDVILATSVLEKLHDNFPGAQIDMLVKKRCNSLFTGHPFIHTLLVWDNQKHKYRELLSILKAVRNKKYDCVIDLHRFASSGFITAFSKALVKAGFRKNPFSFLFDIRADHQIGKESVKHETERNDGLLRSFTSGPVGKVRLYPSQDDHASVAQYKTKPYITIAPFSLWFTKQYPEDLWAALIRNIPWTVNIFLLGSENDKPLLNNFAKKAGQDHVINLAGQLKLLETASLIRDARMNFTNDSAPLHLASSMNAAVTAIFCSTVPAFGFGPLSDDAVVIETEERLDCRPCGIHGRKKCPLGTMACAYGINISRLIERGQR